MNRHTSPLLRWLRPVGLAAIAFACAASAAAQTTVLTLDRAFTIALENSPIIKTVEIQLEQRRLSLQAQQAAMKANMRLTLNPLSYSKQTVYQEYNNEFYDSDGYTSSGDFSINQPIAFTDGTLSLINRLEYTDNSTETALGQRTTQSYQNSVTLNYSQPIFTYNRTKMQLRDLELALMETEFRYVTQRLNLESNITQQFYSLYQTKTNLEIARDEFESAREDYELTVNKVKAGLLAESERYQAEVNMANSELEYENQIEQYENAKEQFKLLAGMSIYDDFEVELEIEHNPIDINLDFAVNSAIQNRMEIKQQGIAIEQAMNDLVTTAAQNEFKGEINLSYGLQSTENEFANLYENTSGTQRVGISLDIPLFDWGESEKRLKVSELSLESLQINNEDERNNIIVNVWQSHRQLEKLLKQIDIARQSERNAELTLNIRREEYRNGDLTGLDLSNYQRQYSQARQATIAALLDYKLALLDMKVLTLYDFENDEQILPESIIGEVE